MPEGDTNGTADALSALAELPDVPGLGAGERAYAKVRAGILRGMLPPGTLLAEAELAEALGISRTPVRSALQLLLQEELVEVGVRRQLKVRDVSPDERREVMLLRGPLERVAVAEACRVMPIEDIDQLRLILIRQAREAERGDVEAFIELDDQFHLGIAKGAQLPTLEKFLGQIRALTRLMGLRAATQHGRMPKVIEEHDKIVSAIEARDEKRALEALDTHLSNTYKTLTGEAPAERRRKR